MLKLIFLAVLIIGLIYVFRLTVLRFKFRFNEKDMLMFFGLPGSGKTTVCADIVRQCECDKHLKHVVPYCNFPMVGAYRVERSEIGVYDLSVGDRVPLVLLDEASTVYYKRNATLKVKNKVTGQMENSFSDTENRFYSMHRHYHTEIVMFAQSWDGVDLRLRELSTGLYYVEPSRMPGLIKIRKISKIFTIDERNQPTDGYEFQKFSKRYVLARRCWKYFDTYDAPALQEFEPELWFPNTHSSRYYKALQNETFTDPEDANPTPDGIE